MAEIHPGIVFLLLAVSVPLQFYFSPSSTSDVKYYLQRVLDKIVKTSSSLGIKLPGQEERLAGNFVVEEPEAAERSEDGYFTSSNEIRERSPEVRFRIGDVVRHKTRGYRAVIIGWDITAKAPEDWIKRVHADNPEWTTQPNFAVLIDERDRAIPQLAYLPQDNMVLASGQVNHYLVKHHMERYDSVHGRYLPKPFLKRLYPDD